MIDIEEIEKFLRERIPKYDDWMSYSFSSFVEAYIEDIIEELFNEWSISIGLAEEEKR